MKTIFLFPKYPDDPTALVQKADTSDKEIDTATKASPGSTTATEKDESETVMKVHSAATTVRKARKPKGKRQDEGTGGELRKQKHNVRNV
jgi:hypothetical protein